MNHKTASPQFMKCQASLRAERSILHSSFFILHFFLLLSFSVSAQTINPRMDSLFHDLARLGLQTKVERDGLLVGGNSRLTYSTYIYYSPDMYSGTPTHWVDSMLNVEKQKFSAQLRAIRSTLDDLAEQARESYHYEYHKDGQDTIIYSINLSPDTTHNDRYRTPSMTYLSSDEVLTFEFRSFSNTTTGQFGNLRYELTLNDTVPQAEMGRYPLEALERDVGRLFKQSGLKPRKARWAHDRQYSDSAYRSNQYFNDYNSITTLHDSTGIRRDGETYLTIYTIPQPMDAQMLTPVGDDEQAEAARTRALQILHQLDSLANKFVNSHPRQTYQYVVDDHRNFFSDRHYWNDFFRANPTPGDYNESYELATGVDERGYHFAVARHKGAKWIPKDWSSLKSYVNGRKEYFK